MTEPWEQKAPDVSGDMSGDAAEVVFRKPKTVVETVTEYLRESIVSCRLRPGEKIQNRSIMEEMGVSNIPLREALRILEKEGLVRSQPGKGSWVADVSRRDLEETFDMREMMETYAVDLIARRAGSRTEITRRLKAMLEGDAPSRQDPGHCAQYHDSLIAMAGNQRLSNLYQMLSNNIRRYQSMSFAMRHGQESCAQGHERIWLALSNQDYELAKEAVRGHLRELRAELLQRLDLPRQQ